MTDGASDQCSADLCRECGYPIEGLDVCPECGWRIGSPVSPRRRTTALVLYYACYIPVIEAVALLAWSVLFFTLPTGARRPAVISVAISLFAVFASSVISALLKHDDRIFARLRWVSFTLAIVIGAGLGLLAVIRPGGHAVLLYALAIFNAALAIAALESNDARVSVLEPMNQDGSNEDDPHG